MSGDDKVSKKSLYIFISLALFAIIVAFAIVNKQVNELQEIEQGCIDEGYDGITLAKDNDEDVYCYKYVFNETDNTTITIYSGIIATIV